MPHDDLRKAYDDLWEASWRGELEAPGASYRTRRRLFLRLFEPLYESGASVLDVGCGNGSLLADIAARHRDVGPLMGVDIAEAAVEQARIRTPHARFMQADPQREPLPARNVDIVTACEVLEHVPDYAAVLRHMHDALRPGGHMIISVPHGMRYWGPHDEAVHHVRRFEYDELRAAVADAGFEVLRAFTWGALVYRAYYAMVLNRIQPEATGRPKSRAMRALHAVLYRLFYLDDLAESRTRGRMLFIVGRRRIQEEGRTSP